MPPRHTLLSIPASTAVSAGRCTAKMGRSCETVRPTTSVDAMPGVGMDPAMALVPSFLWALGDLWGSVRAVGALEDRWATPRGRDRWAARLGRAPEHEVVG